MRYYLRHRFTVICLRVSLCVCCRVGSEIMGRIFTKFGSHTRRRTFDYILQAIRIIIWTVNFIVFIHIPVVTHTHTHPFNSPFSGTTRVSRYQKGKPIGILLKQETVSGSGISWTICKSAPRSRQITMPAPHHSVFYRPDALLAAQPTVSKH